MRSPEEKATSDDEPRGTEAEQKGGAAGAPAPDTVGPGEQLRCPECGRENPPDCIFCLNCGAMLPAVEAKPPAEPVPQAGPRKRRRRWLMAGAAVLVCLGLVLLLYVLPSFGGGLLRLEYALGRRSFGRANLIGANLRGANLRGADLGLADLNEAFLREADLSVADLSWANLSFADLRRANLISADLGGADLSEAHLEGTNLNGADLSGADLTGATVTAETLARVKSLKGATVPDGLVHE